MNIAQLFDKLVIQRQGSFLDKNYAKKTEAVWHLIQKLSSVISKGFLSDVV